MKKTTLKIDTDDFRQLACEIVSELECAMLIHDDDFERAVDKVIIALTSSLDNQ